MPGSRYIVFLFDQVYVKHTCDHVSMTLWGRVFYTNFLALCPIFLSVLGELQSLAAQKWSVQVVLRQKMPSAAQPQPVSNLFAALFFLQAILALILSCSVGLGMSHSSYCLRENVSATLFTVVGIVCKLITVAINFAIWGKHTSAWGAGFLFIW